LELKRDFFHLVYPCLCNLQSHHFGIETLQPLLVVWRGNPLQSHHFGIETGQNKRKEKPTIPCNRTILELKHWLRNDVCNADFTCNRTILELKRSSLAWIRPTIARLQSHHFGIETWNARPCHGWISNLQSHHFGIET